MRRAPEESKLGPPRWDCSRFPAKFRKLGTEGSSDVEDAVEESVSESESVWSESESDVYGL